MIDVMLLLLEKIIWPDIEIVEIIVDQLILLLLMLLAINHYAVPKYTIRLGVLLDKNDQPKLRSSMTKDPLTTDPMIHGAGKCVD